MDGREVQLSDLPEPILLDILSKLGDGKEIVRSSLLCKQLRYLWMRVPVSLSFYFSDDQSGERIDDCLASVNRDLHYWSFCEKIRTFKVGMWRADNTRLVKDVDMWVHFASKVGNVEGFDLLCGDYELPQFAFKNTSWKNLVLGSCKMNPCDSVSWTSLVSLSIEYVNLRDGVIEKVLCGSPNLECLEIFYCCGFRRLEISSVKLTKLVIQENLKDGNDVVLIEIYAPNLLTMQLYGIFRGILLKNVTSLVTAELELSFHCKPEEDRLEEEELLKLKGLLHCVAHAENLALGLWCIEYLYLLELKGWKFPPSSRKSLKINATLKQLDFPGVCSFLQRSSNLETLAINCHYDEPERLLSRHTNKDKQSGRFEMHNVNCSLIHLKTIRIINFHGSRRKYKFVVRSLAKYVLKNATALEKFIFTCTSQERAVSGDFVKIEKELQRLPRSSPHASIIFSFS